MIRPGGITKHQRTSAGLAQARDVRFEDCTGIASAHFSTVARISSSFCSILHACIESISERVAAAL